MVNAVKGYDLVESEGRDCNKIGSIVNRLQHYFVHKIYLLERIQFS